MEDLHGAEYAQSGLLAQDESLNCIESGRYRWGNGLEQVPYRKRQLVLDYLSSLTTFGAVGRVVESLELPDLSSLGGDKQRRHRREIRRCRRTSCRSTVARTSIVTLVVILIFFGVLHILQALVGRARFFWNDTSRAFGLPPKHALLHPSVGTLGSSDVRHALVPIPCHSHNDYQRDEPLLEAIRWGCIGVEADVWHFDHELYVGHRSASLRENRTLRSMYIDPLVKILDEAVTAANTTLDQLSVFETAPSQTLALLIDFKNEPEETFLMVRQQLQPLRERGYLSFSDGVSVTQRAITVVGTGSFPFETLISNTKYRDIFFDAPLDALWEPPREPISKSDSLHDKDGEIDYGTAMSLAPNSPTTDTTLYNTTTSYYASTSFAAAVGFVWRGHLSPRQMTIIRGQIRGAKRRGLKARYWDTPTWPVALRNHVWHVLVKEGMDLVSVDDLEAAATYDWTLPMYDNLFG